MPDAEDAVPLGRLTRRNEFLRAAKGRRWHKGSLTVQASSVDPSKNEARIGFTLTRKVGCAVVRNRVRRRLKEVVRLSFDLPVEAGRDYVILGRIEALRLPFDRLKRDMAQAIRGVTEIARRPPAKGGAGSENAGLEVIRPGRTSLKR